MTPLLLIALLRKTILVVCDSPQRPQANLSHTKCWYKFSSKRMRFFSAAFCPIGYRHFGCKITDSYPRCRDNTENRLRCRDVCTHKFVTVLKGLRQTCYKHSACHPPIFGQHSVLGDLEHFGQKLPRFVPGVGMTATALHPPRGGNIVTETSHQN